MQRKVHLNYRQERRDRNLGLKNQINERRNSMNNINKSLWKNHSPSPSEKSQITKTLSSNEHTFLAKNLKDIVSGFRTHRFETMM